MNNLRKTFGVLFVVIVIIAVIGGVVHAYRGNKEKNALPTTPSSEYSNVPFSEGAPTSSGISSQFSSLQVSPPQNADEVASAQASAGQNASQINGTQFVITAPLDSILEPGKPCTIAYSPVNNAHSYKITLTKPAWTNKEKTLVSRDRVDTLLMETTVTTSHTIVVPSTDAFFISEASYNGEEITVSALDEHDQVLMISYDRQGRTYQVPAITKKQIKILPPPTQPQLLKADTYILPKEGGSITLSFGALPPPLTSRVVSLVGLVGSFRVTLDSVVVPEDVMPPSKNRLTFGPESLTKILEVGPNPFPRDTVFALRVQYFDSAGNEPNPQGLNDESWISIKVSK